MQKFLSLLPLAVVTAVSASEEPVIVITPTGIETPLEETAPSTTVISRDEIERNNYISVEQALRSTPGLTVARSGSLGQQTSIFVRGTNSNHVLVMIDGVKINDTTTPAGAFDFANLTADAIERIEVVRGPQSTLYGSEAIGGVINIITRKGEGESGGSIELFGGSANTFKQGATLYGGDHGTNYLVSLSHIKTDGEDASVSGLGYTPADDDGYENTTLTARIGFEISPQTRLEFSGQLVDSSTELDTSWPGQADVPMTDLRSWYLRAAMENRFADDRWKSRLSLDRHSSERETTFYGYLPDWSIGVGTYDYEGSRDEIEWRNDLYFLENHVITAGAKWEKETADTISSVPTDYEATTGTFYLHDQFALENGLFGTVGVRHDTHSEFGGETTWRIAPGYLVADTATRLKASIGTGFKTPSLYQLFDPVSGNPDLQPESSLGWEIGFDQSLMENSLSFGATWFNNRLENMIDWVKANDDPYDFEGYYFNVDEAETEGIETFVSYRFSDRLSARLDYTWMKTRDENGDPLYRRPEHAADLRLDYVPHDKASFSALIHHVGERDDLMRGVWPETRTRMPAYTTLDINGQYELNDTATITASLTNLTDEDYQPVHGYQGEGRRIYLGLKVEL